jgi:hypothetical protein
MKLKTIDFNDKSFKANGNEYFIEREVSIQRSVYAEVAKLEMEGSAKVGKQIDDWAKIYELANQQKFADIVVMAYNHQRGFQKLLKEHSPVLRFCACFINTADEDRRSITDDQADKKIQDWIEEGISMQSFFDLALTFLKIEVEGYKNATESISAVIKQYNEMLSAQQNIPISK